MQDVRFIPTSQLTSLDNTEVKTSDNQKGHSLVATFVVKTPSLDHSGLAHLAEHMCFRGSPAYPADHELFIANSLLPLSINATTYADATYFYVTSCKQDLFFDAIDYLYSGLLCHHYTKAQFEAERSGVLFNELSMREADPLYRQQGGIRLADTSTQAYMHAGGFSHTIDKLSLLSLKQYKKRWYTKDTISLIVIAPDKAVFEKCRALIKQNDIAPRSLVKQEILGKVPDEMKEHLSSSDNTFNHKDTEVTTWWFPAPYLSDLLEVEPRLKCVIGAQGSLVIDNEINHTGKFALRLLLENPTPLAVQTIKNDIIRVLQKQNIQPKQREFHDKKLPRGVQIAIQQHQQIENTTALEIAPLAHYLPLSQQSSIATIPSKVPNAFSKPNDIVPSHFATRHADSLSLQHIPSLPKLLHPCAIATTNQQRFQSYQQHWVYRVDVKNESAFLSLLCRADFWRPRTQGECYALGVARHQGQLYLYGAQDTYINFREAWCKQTLTSLA